MSKQTVESLIEGGKATAAPPLGPALGPLGVNIGQIVQAINEKTKDFKGMQVPVKVSVDSDTKAFEIFVGTPPVSSLLIKESGIEKGSSNPLRDKVADVLIEQIIKIAKMKGNSLLGKTIKERVKEVMGSANSMGILVEGRPAAETIKLVNEGVFDAEIKSEKTELSAEELKNLAEEKKKLAEEIESRRVEFEAKANEIINKMKNSEKSAIKSKLREADIPEKIIKELLPDTATAPAAGAKGAPAGKGVPEAGKGEKK